MKLRTYREVAEELDEALQWIASLGINIEPSRIKSYRDAVAQIADLHEAGRGNIWDVVGLGSGFNASFEADELISIYRTLRIHEGTLFERLRQFVKGPEFYVDERSETSSNRARNIAFELATAARFVRGGFNVDFGSGADLMVWVEGQPVFIECKRPQKNSQLHSNAKAALRQLEKRYLCHSDPKSARGIVALSITKIINPQARYLSVADEHEATAELYKICDDFVERNQREWRNLDDPRTIGALIEFRCCAHLRSRNLMTVCGQVAMSYVGDPRSPSRSIALSLTHRLSDGRNFSQRTIA